MSVDPNILSPAAFHILIALADGNKHGYAVMKEVSTATAGEVQLNPGTLYTTIKRLLEEGFIRETNAPAGTNSSDARRRYYALTSAGRRAAKAELERLQELIQHAGSKLFGELAG